MKTKFSVEIHANGTANEAIMRMITNHNEGKVSIDLSVIQAYCRAYFAQWPTISPKFGMIENVGKHTLELSENDKPTLTVTEKEVYELKEENNITQSQNY